MVYQIYPRSFKDSNGDGIGDLCGIISCLDYIKSLGVDVIWLNPIYASPNDDNGYDISDYRAIMKEFGTMEDFDLLLREVHARNLKLILDLVVNHTSDEHPWFQEARKSRKNPYYTYYHWWPVEQETPPLRPSYFEESAWTYDPHTRAWYLHYFSRKQPDLNWENREVREAVYDMMRFWFDKGIDGFRMDSIPLIAKDPAFPPIDRKKYPDLFSSYAHGPHLHEYLHEMNREVLSKYDIMTVGETPHTNADEAALYTDESRKELNMVFHFDHMHLDYDENGKYATNRVPLVALKKVMTQWQDKMHECNGWNSLYWCNHDQARAVTRFGNDSEEYREISAKMLGTCLHMMQGTPYIYEGEELGMTNADFTKLEEYKDVEALDIFKDFTERKGFSKEDTLHLLHLKSRDNARTPMQWDASENAGFSEAQPWIRVNANYKKINAENALADSDSVFYYYQKLIALRHELPIITDGVYELLDAENEKIYAYLRKGEKESLIVLCNFTDETVEYEVDESVKAERSKLVISNYKDAPEKFASKITMKPYGAYVYYTK